MNDLVSSDWERLRELRDDFLEASSQPAGESLPDYWNSRRDLELYDCTFGERIGWKWRAVLDELRLRRLEPPVGHVVEWGCGTGVGARAYLRAFGAGHVQRLSLLDRSPAAEHFARERVHDEHPGVAFAEESLATPPLHADGARAPIDGAPLSSASEHASGAIRPTCDVLLLSHVLSELDDAEQSELVSLIRTSRWVVWVEPGTYAVSRRLSTLRDVLRDEFEALAPCTHDAACGMLAEGQASNWCHHFARPPAEVHQSRHWSQVSRQLGIDLRSLPYSFLVLARRTPGASPASSSPVSANPASANPTNASSASASTSSASPVSASPVSAIPASATRSSASPSTSNTARILGRPRMEKASARIDACDKDGVHDWMLLQREDKALFKLLGDSAGECLIFDWRVEGKRITAPRRALPEAEGTSRAAAWEEAT